MLNKVLYTPVDKLVEVVKNNNNSSITFLSKELNVPKEILESCRAWITNNSGKNLIQPKMPTHDSW